jgi:hypothetical protein
MVRRIQPEFSMSDKGGRRRVEETERRAEIGHSPIRRDFSDPVGLSMRDGDPVLTVDDLPGHRVVAHVFRGADEASAFVAGLKVMFSRNTMGYSWQVGDLAANRVVFVAYFDEPRPDVEHPMDAIEIVGYEATGHDSRAIAEGTRRSQEQNRRLSERNEEKAKVVQKPLEEAGFKMGWSYSRSFRFSNDEDYYDCSWSDEGGPYSVSKNISYLSNHDETTARIVKEVCARHGLSYDGVRDQVTVEAIPGPEGLPASVVLLEAAKKEWDELRLAEYERIFRASMKMTASRRRFLTGAAIGSIYSYVNRRDHHLTAGGVDITRTEIAALKRMRWIAEIDRHVWEITDEGRTAAGVAPTRPSDEESVAPRI